MKYRMPPILTVAAVLLTTASFFKAGWTHSAVYSTQNGYRDLTIEQIAIPEDRALPKLATTLQNGIDKAAVSKNVGALNDVRADQFKRVMLSITIAPWFAMFSPLSGGIGIVQAGMVVDDLVSPPVVDPP